MIPTSKASFTRPLWRLLERYGFDLDCWQPAANRKLVGESDQILAAFLNGLQPEDLIARVKLAIVEGLPSGSPSDEAIAKTLSTSSRTLQRRLASAGTTYYQLLDAVRYQLAEQYIADPSRSLKEISFLLSAAVRLSLWGNRR